MNLQPGAATGGLCGGSYSYQWLSSVDSIHFTPIAGAIGQSYQPGPLAETTWFRRQVTCSASGAVTTDPIKITVAAALPAITLAPSWQGVTHSTLPAALTFSLPSKAASISYYWQTSVNADFSGATIIAGAHSSSFSPDSMSATAYYRVVLTSGGDTAYSNPAVVAVYPPLNAGTLMPVNQTILSDSLPELMACTGTTGGSGPYSYQLYSSLDGSNWNLIPGVITAGYNPGILMNTTYFKVLVTSNESIAYSTTALINVTPQQ